MEKEKEKVLVCDNKSIFLKMFKRKFKEEFIFFENDTINVNQTELENFDHVVYVIYNKIELVELLKLENKGKNVLVFLFDKSLYERLFFLEELSDLFLLDASKTRMEIVKDLKLHFKKRSNTEIKKTEISFSNSKVQFNNYYKTLFFLM